MIKGKQPESAGADFLKTKARNSASVLGSLIFSGYKGLKYVADYDLILYFIGVHLVASSIKKDCTEAARLGVGTNPEAFATVAKMEILKELQYLNQIESNNKKT
jgi:hypothetical protein